jgi:hypothetical protein
MDLCCLLSLESWSAGSIYREFCLDLFTRLREDNYFTVSKIYRVRCVVSFSAQSFFAQPDKNHRSVKILNLSIESFLDNTIFFRVTSLVFF